MPSPDSILGSSVRCHLAGTAIAQTFEQLPTAIIKKIYIKEKIYNGGKCPGLFVFFTPAPKVGFWPAEEWAVQAAVPGGQEAKPCA